MRKILVIRFSSLGDLILTTPIYREIKRVFPESEIHVLTSTHFGPILQNNPSIGRLWLHPRKESRAVLEKLIESLKKESFNIVYDAHASLRSRWICQRLKFSGGKIEFWQINKRSWERQKWVWMQGIRKPSYLSQRHLLLEPLTFQTTQSLQTQTELFPSQTDAHTALGFLSTYLTENPKKKNTGMCGTISFFFWEMLAY